MNQAIALQPVCFQLKAPAPREAKEVFGWARLQIDVSAILADINCGKLIPGLRDLDADFISSYGKRVLALDKAKPRTVDQTGSFFVGISTLHALTLPEHIQAEPVILIYAGKNKGMLDMGTGVSYLLCDGNHRMALAYLNETPSVQAYVLSEAQSRRYRYRH